MLVMEYSIPFIYLGWILYPVAAQLCIYSRQNIKYLSQISVCDASTTIQNMSTTYLYRSWSDSRASCVLGLLCGDGTETGRDQCQAGCRHHWLVPDGWVLCCFVSTSCVVVLCCATASLSLLSLIYAQDSLSTPCTESSIKGENKENSQSQKSVMATKETFYLHNSSKESTTLSLIL